MPSSRLRQLTVSLSALPEARRRLQHLSCCTLLERIFPPFLQELPARNRSWIYRCPTSSINFSSFIYLMPRTDFMHSRIKKKSFNLVLRYSAQRDPGHCLENTGTAAGCGQELLTEGLEQLLRSLIPREWKRLAASLQATALVLTLYQWEK